jgi:hypothetical protein
MIMIGHVMRSLKLGPKDHATSLEESTEPDKWGYTDSGETVHPGSPLRTGAEFDYEATLKLISSS